MQAARPGERERLPEAERLVGALLGVEHPPPPVPRTLDVVALLGTGARLGKTTGWIHRTTLKMKRVKMQGGVKKSLFGGEGLFLVNMTGPGHVTLQTLPFTRTARRIREAQLSSIRLIALSGHGLPQDRSRAIEAGFDEHLVKPITPDRLLGALGPATPEAFAKWAGVTAQAAATSAMASMPNTPIIAAWP